LYPLYQRFHLRRQVPWVPGRRQIRLMSILCSRFDHQGSIHDPEFDMANSARLGRITNSGNSGGAVGGTSGSTGIPAVTHDTCVITPVWFVRIRWVLPGKEGQLPRVHLQCRTHFIPWLLVLTTRKVFKIHKMEAAFYRTARPLNVICSYLYIVSQKTAPLFFLAKRGSILMTLVLLWLSSSLSVRKHGIEFATSPELCCCITVSSRTASDLMSMLCCCI